jgi:hypothetical protein
MTRPWAGSTTRTIWWWKTHKRALEKGFTAMKLKVGSADPERENRRAELIRKTAGDAAHHHGGRQPAVDGSQGSVCH